MEVIAHPLVTITNTIWSYDQAAGTVQVLLVRRSEKPFAGYWGLPDTFLRPDENADQAALRLVHAKIGVALAEPHVEQLATFTNTARVFDGQRHLALAYQVFLPGMPELEAGAGATDVRWFTLEPEGHHYQLHSGPLTFATQDDTGPSWAYYDRVRGTAATELAFDHGMFLRVAAARIANKLDYSPSILRILGSAFTLKQARMVFAPFLRVQESDIDNSNFRRTHAHLFIDLGTVSPAGKGRPARQYKLRDDI